MAWVCRNCSQLVDDRQPACTACGHARVVRDGEPLVGQGTGVLRDLEMEAHLRAIAAWHVIVGLLGILGGIALMAISVAATPSTLAEERMYGQIFVGAGVGLGSSVATFLVGVYLGRLLAGARVAAGVFTASGVVFALLALGRAVVVLSGHPTVRQHLEANLALGGAVLLLGADAALLWALFSPRAANVTSAEYRNLIASTPDTKPRIFASPFFYAPAGLVALALIVAILVAG